MVMRILEDHPNSPIGMIFDAKGDTFRHDMYKEYKANRPPMPDDLLQIQPIYDIVEALGIKIFVVDNVEADDVIGTLAKQAEEKGISTVISTGDKDLAYNSIAQNIKLVNTMTNEVLDQKGVEKKFGATRTNHRLLGACRGYFG